MHVFRMDIRNGCILSAVRLRTADRGQMHYAGERSGWPLFRVNMDHTEHDMTTEEESSR